MKKETKKNLKLTSLVLAGLLCTGIATAGVMAATSETLKTANTVTFKTEGHVHAKFEAYKNEVAEENSIGNLEIKDETEVNTEGAFQSATLSNIENKSDWTKNGTRYSTKIIFVFTNLSDVEGNKLSVTNTAWTYLAKDYTAKKNQEASTDTTTALKDLIKDKSGNFEYTYTLDYRYGGVFTNSWEFNLSASLGE